ncbi:MAG: bifunctional oligoribonuclease/PAP phosphatase NrnA [Deltaproteobacteria bacterium]|nr:bifunctional oligoribonuclease/PAP phosphatase NrnA [Deltaproteobacteria bacterium]
MSNKLLALIKQSKSFFIAGHYHPDGDALGSALALAMGLKKLKKEAVVYNRDPVPYNLRFLPHSDWITSKMPARKFDVAIMVDCAQPKRISDAFEQSLKNGNFGTLVCIDHHILHQKVGDIDWIDAAQASTGCVIWKLLKKMNLHKSKEVASLVYTTLVVDTGSFRYSNTTTEVLRLAADLVALGADPWTVARNLEESDPIQRYHLMELALKSLAIQEKGLFASMELTREMFKKSGAKEEDAEEFSGIPRSLRGVEVAALFRESEEGKVKVSLRSKLTVDVAKIAGLFGGGGHKHAAGCNFTKGLEDAKQKIRAAVRLSLRGA